MTKSTKSTCLNPVGSIEMNLFKYDAPTFFIPDLVLKYEKPSKVIKHAHESLVPLIEQMIEKIKEYDDRSIVIDYKVRTLKEGDTGSGIFGYHLDCTNDVQDDFEPETHLIYSTVIGTSFVMNPINTKDYKSVQQILQNEVLVESVAPTETVHKFTSKVLHSCPKITHDCQRILIRVTAGFKERIEHNKEKKCI